MHWLSVQLPLHDKSGRETIADNEELRAGDNRILIYADDGPPSSSFGRYDPSQPGRSNNSSVYAGIAGHF
jgi:hypothetical protein